MMLRLLVIVTACSLLGFAATAEDKPSADAKLMQGSWDWDPAEKQSDALPVILVERIVVKDNHLTIHYNMGGQKFTSENDFKLDDKAMPKEIDFTPTEAGNANKGKTYLGLYEVSAKQLKICYRGPGSTRPKDFNDKSAGNDVTTFLVLKPPPSI